MGVPVRVACLAKNKVSVSSHTITVRVVRRNRKASSHGHRGDIRTTPNVFDGLLVSKKDFSMVSNGNSCCFFVVRSIINDTPFAKDFEKKGNNEARQLEITRNEKVIIFLL